MSADPHANDCCGITIREGARFCSKCGRELTAAEKARAAPKVTPPALPEAINCSNCGTPAPLDQLIEPLYEMFRETPEDNALANSQPSRRERAVSAGKLLLPDVDSLESRLQDGMLAVGSDFERDLRWRSEVNRDPVIAAFDQAARIARAAARPRGGHRLTGLVVLPCQACGQADPAGLMAAMAPVQQRLSTRRRHD